MKSYRFGCCLPWDRSSNPASHLLESWNLRMEQGYDYAEGYAAAITELSDSEFDQLLHAHAAGRFLLETCNGFIPASVPLIGEKSDPEKTEAFVNKALSRIAALGAKLVVFGSGDARQRPDTVSEEHARRDVIAFLRLCEPYAKQNNIRIVIEPLCAKECNIINTVAEAWDIAESLQAPHIGVLADFYHMGQEHEPAESLRAYIPRLWHVHISELSDRTRPGNHGGEECRSFLESLSQIGYEGRISVEAILKNAEDSANALAFLRGIR